jgi:hypothetical protein
MGPPGGNLGGLFHSNRSSFGFAAPRLTRDDKSKTKEEPWPEKTAHASSSNPFWCVADPAPARSI